VQGLFEVAGIPYVGAGVLGAAIGMNKDGGTTARVRHCETNMMV